ncbi:MAG TPA: hypothetical protein PLG67_14685, partial [Bacillota bacterium]|nr:hypothetical protein [Bacillota bacterium]
AGMEAGLGVSGHGGPFDTVRTFPRAYQYRPVKIIIRVPRYTILSLAEDYANFRYDASFLLCSTYRSPIK